MDRTLIVVVMSGIIVALCGLISAIVCIINYGLGNTLTIIFFSVFVVGLLIAGLAYSQ